MNYVVIGVTENCEQITIFRVNRPSTCEEIKSFFKLYGGSCQWFEDPPQKEIIK